MEQFIYNIIHMTEGEKLINYWWLWLIIVALAFLIPFTYSGIRTPGKETGVKKPKD